MEPGFSPLLTEARSQGVSIAIDRYGIRQSVPETRGDTVLDPFSGTGNTILAALNTGRNSIGVDIDAEYCRFALRRLDTESGPLFAQASIEYHNATDFLASANVPAVADRPTRKSGSRRKDHRP